MCVYDCFSMFVCTYACLCVCASIFVSTLDDLHVFVRLCVCVCLEGGGGGQMLQSVYILLFTCTNFLVTFRPFMVRYTFHSVGFGGEPGLY